MQARIGRVWIPGLMLAGLVVRLWFIHFIPVIETDGAAYARLAQEILTGSGERGFHPAWPPLYPYVIALFDRVIHPGMASTLEGLARPDRVENAARVASCVLGTLLIPLLHLLGRRIAGRRVGVVAACLAAFHPRLLMMSVQALTEMPFAFVCTLFMLALGSVLNGPDVDGTGPRRRGPLSLLLTAALAGVAGGLAYLTRPEGFVLLPVGALAILVSAAIRHRHGATSSLVRSLAAPAVFAIVFLGIMAPHVARVSRAVGYFSIGSKSEYNLIAAYAGQPGVPRMDRSRSAYNNFPAPAAGLAFQPEPVPRFSVARLALERPGIVARHILGQLPASLAALPSLAYFPFFLLALGGIGLRREKRRAEEFAWLGFWLGLVALYSCLFVYRRFFSGALPFVLVEAAIGLVLVCRRHTPFIAVAVIAAAAYGVITAAIDLRNEHYPVEQREIAAAAASVGAADDPAGRASPLANRRIMARKPFAAYYAGDAILAMPDVAAVDLAQSARSRGAALIVIDERDLVREKPPFRDLLDFTSAPAGLIPVAATGREPFRAVLYRVTSDSSGLSP